MTCRYNTKESENRNKKKRPKGSPLIKMGNKHPIPLANEQKFFDQGVWSKCLQAGEWYQYS
jgi:uracil DNA glycosylase